MDRRLPSTSTLRLRVRVNRTVYKAILGWDRFEQAYWVDVYLSSALRNKNHVIDVILDTSIESEKHWESWVPCYIDRKDVIPLWNRYEEEVDYVFQYPVDNTHSVYEALYQAINEVMRREFKWLLETKLESIRQLHPGMPLWQDGEFRELTDEDLVAYGYQRLGVKGTMKQARESAEQRVKVLNKE